MKIKKYLEERRITQLEIAEVLEKERTTINKKLNGTLKFSYEEVIKLQDYLNLTEEETRHYFL